MKHTISDFALLDQLIRDGFSQPQICAALSIGKLQLNRELKINKGVGYKQYVGQVLGKYRLPVCLERKITETQLRQLVVDHESLQAICRVLGVTKGALNKLCKHFGYKTFTDFKRKVLNIAFVEIESFEKQIMALVKEGNDFKAACLLCGVNYNSFLLYFSKKYKVSARMYVASLQGKRIYEMHERQEYRRDWLKKNPAQKLSKRISTSLLKCLGKNKLQNTSQILKNHLGYSISDLKQHLEGKFDEFMNWQNYGSYWHIDHKKPVSWFNFTSFEDEDFKACWALENLQPKEAIENSRKGNRYIG